MAIRPAMPAAIAASAGIAVKAAPEANAKRKMIIIEIKHPHP